MHLIDIKIIEKDWITFMAMHKSIVNVSAMFDKKEKKKIESNIKKK